ncbi:MAG: helix-turn-helix domain-containing protein [Sphingomonas sp.]
MTNVRLDYAVPAADLQEYVTLFYYFRADLPKFEDVERADYAQLRFRLSPAATGYRFADGVTQSATDIHLLGPTCGPVRSWSDGPILLFGMGLTAAGWRAMIGNDASQMLNRSVDAEGLLGSSRLQAARVALANVASVEDCAAIAEPLVRELIGNRLGTSLVFVRQVDGWLAASPSPEMDDLIAVTGLSRRQIERKCKAMYGAPPKMLARKYRALKAAVALASNAETFDDAIERGFYDQSHMIREVKQFTGMTPRQFHAEPSLLSQLVTAQRTALEDKVGPLIART